MKIKAILAAGALAMAGQAAADDHAPRALTAHEQRVYDIYRDIIAFRTAAGHGQMDDMVAYLTGRLAAAGSDQEGRGAFGRPASRKEGGGGGEG